MRDPTCVRDKVDDIYVAKAIHFIEEHEQRHQDKPFFVYLPLNAIHGAVSVPERFADKSELAYREDKILWANESVGKILATLDRLKITDDTLVMFTSDNGPIKSEKAKKKGHPPIMLVHGAKDTVVIINSTDDFFKKMKAVGAEITYLRYEDAGHAVMGQKGAKTMPATYTFFDKHLNGKAATK